MEWLCAYILQVTSAALVCGLLRMIVGKSGAVAGTLRMITAVFMLIMLLSPLDTFTLKELPDILDEFSGDADGVVASGEQYRYHEMSSIIKERTEAYIFDKAAAFDAELSVNVGLSGDDVPFPITVTIDGAISPYGKARLSKIIADELGIPMEAQTWKNELS